VGSIPAAPPFNNPAKGSRSAKPVRNSGFCVRHLESVGAIWTVALHIQCGNRTSTWHCNHGSSGSWTEEKRISHNSQLHPYYHAVL